MHDEPSLPAVPPPDGPPPLDLDVLLRHGYLATDSLPDERARQILEHDGGEWTQILLRDAGPDTAPPAIGGGGLLQGRYRMDGEIAKGGMGVVLRARDMTLFRDVAIKILRSRHESSQVMRDRFLEEAQIGAQLQHPGIVPVHDIGMVGTRRPFFAMKLVQGRTLAALLAERTSPKDQLPRFVSIFERICQTVAYAHSRSVIHRDLKPSNVMLGAFGEVQVTDWGMAKVLAEGGLADEMRAVRQAPSAPVITVVDNDAAAIETVRSGSDGTSASVAGSVFGTPGYMAPEQARGETDAVNERADVFALGAILTEILTGRPAFRGAREVALAQARLGDVEDASADLRGSGADAELIELAIACLAPDAGARPATARVVVDAIARHTGKVAERAQTAILAAARSEARASAERRARKMATALCASVLVAVCAGLLTWGWIESRDRSRRERTAEVVDLALADGRAEWQAAAASSSDVQGWHAVAAVARRAADLAAAGPADAATQVRARTFAEEVASAVAAAELRAVQAGADDRLRARLEELRAMPAGGLDWQRADREYVGVFAGLGLDIEQGELRDVAERVRSHRLAVHLVAGLDDWAMARQNATHDPATNARIVAVARLSDPDPVRSDLRALLVTPDAEAAKRVAAAIDLVQATPSTIWLLERALRIAGERKLARELFAQGQACHPGDFWLALRLGQECAAAGDVASAVRYNSAALAVRPDSLIAGVRLCADLVQSGRTLEALAVLRQLHAHHPTDPAVVHNLGAALLAVGRPHEALPFAEQAVSLDPTFAASAVLLANILRKLGRHEEARVQYELTASKNLRDAQPLISLGAMLCDDLQQFEAARDAFERAIVVDPSRGDAHFNLGVVFDHLGCPGDALASWHRSAATGAGHANSFFNIAVVDLSAGRCESACDAAQRAVALEPGNWLAWQVLGEALAALDERHGAIGAWRRAVTVKPEFGEAWFRLGQEMVEQPATLAEAIAALHRAVAIQPESTEWQVALGRALLRAGRVDEAASAADAAVGVSPGDADALRLKAEVAAKRNR